MQKVTKTTGQSTTREEKLAKKSTRNKFDPVLWLSLKTNTFNFWASKIVNCFYWRFPSKRLFYLLVQRCVFMVMKRSLLFPLSKSFLIYVSFLSFQVWRGLGFIYSSFCLYNQTVQETHASESRICSLPLSERNT